MDLPHLATPLCLKASLTTLSTVLPSLAQPAYRQPATGLLNPSLHKSCLNQSHQQSPKCMVSHSHTTCSAHLLSVGFHYPCSPYTFGLGQLLKSQAFPYQQWHPNLHLWSRCYISTIQISRVSISCILLPILLPTTHHRQITNPILPPTFLFHYQSYQSQLTAPNSTSLPFWDTLWFHNVLQTMHWPLPSPKKNFSWIYSFLNMESIKMLIHALITSRLDYCNFSSVPLLSTLN